MVAGGRAVVLGGGIAGLCAAQALMRRFDDVVLVERDRFPDGPKWRRGVPHSGHAHNLFQSGLAALERLFPGIEDELVAHGIRRVRMPDDVLLLTPGGWMRRFEGRHVMLTGSRELLDWVVRTRIETGGRARIRDGCEVTGVRVDAGEVTGVEVRERNANGDGWGEPAQLAADLVVDATGRHSRAAEWLRRWGYGVPQETVIDSRTVYATCVFKRPDTHDADWESVLIQATTDAPQAGILIPLEGDRWLVSLALVGADRAPAGVKEFREVAERMRSPIIAEALEKAEPLTPVSAYGVTENRWRRFDALDDFPRRLVLVGDSAGYLNPSYSQGVSVAARTAVALDRALAEAPTLDAAVTALREEAGRIFQPAWKLSVGSDLRWLPAVRLPLRGRILQWYMQRLVEVAAHHRRTALALLDALHMTGADTALFHPAVVLAVLRGARGGDVFPTPKPVRRPGKPGDQPGDQARRTT
ncbi:FAD-dependent monooxygenase [Actinomadura sp. KC216]|uniref:NAD(P)/FAD-dependent oxidoreductase n=1 Tax=Actinomadura sp. KC216 TaxID=2530370 RepID=UPI0014044148|nr:FAD-dependent monooxygenase [Actinomadura sp. KC216]